MQNTAIQLETLDAAGLINYINELKTNFNQQINELKINLKNKESDYEVLEEKYKQLIYKRFAQSTEKLLAREKQILLFDPEEIKEETGKVKQEEITQVRSFKRKKNAGRKPIDAKIPREEKIIDIPESEKECACGAKLNKIGQKTSEKLQIEPPRIYVEKTIRPKYACPCCEGTEDEGKPAVRIAPPEPAIIPKGIASASLLSWIFTYKYEFHLPFYRQEILFSRMIASISRQDMSNWQQQVYGKLKPLFELLKETLKKGPVIKLDETTLQVMGEPERDDTQKSYMWLSLGGPIETPVVIYQYRETRAGEHAREILEGYKGYIQTDGYIGYDSALKGNNEIIHSGCFAHCRRYFFDAVKISSRAETAEAGIEYIKKLYVIENKLRKRYENNADSEEEKIIKRKMFTRIRQLCTYRPLKEFKEWLLIQQEEVPPSTLLGKAVGYSLEQWDKLVRYRETPYLTPDNNECENAIRPFVLGRKSWMFNKSPKGADSSCGIFTLIQTAKLNKLVPFQYLKTLFEKAPYASTPEDWEKLLPWNIFNS